VSLFSTAIQVLTELRLKLKSSNLSIKNLPYPKPTLKTTTKWKRKRLNDRKRYLILPINRMQMCLHESLSKKIVKSTEYEKFEAAILFATLSLLILSYLGLNISFTQAS
jgi:hypothetical protein